VEHGDVVVWGGVDRMTFHGIAELPRGQHPLTGDRRYNLTFRVAR
jgi:alkylated DNA repair protein (DNA oxidative demethylase)